MSNSELIAYAVFLVGCAVTGWILGTIAFMVVFG